MKKVITDIPMDLISIEGDGYHLMIEVHINGKEARMLVDTGASKSVFDKSRMYRFVENLECQVNDQLSTGLGTNSMESHSTILQKITIGDLIIKDYKAILIDLSHVNDSYTRIKIAPIDGVIGSDILNANQAVINYGKKQLKLKYNICND